jgi:hypothetical protein
MKDVPPFVLYAYRFSALRKAPRKSRKLLKASQDFRVWVRGGEGLGLDVSQT